MTSKALRAHPDRWRVAADLAGVALIALIVGMFAIRNTIAQPDFRTYLAAGRAAFAGIDPYRPDHLSAVAGRPVLPFVYPPITLVPFVPLTAIPQGPVLNLWMGLNVALLGVLVVSWWRGLGAGIALLPLALAAVFGWNASALTALRSGNVALIEAALVWSALIAFAHARRILFAALIVVAACFKLVPAILLLLLLVPTERSAPNPRALLLSFSLLAVLVAGPVIAGPASRWSFFIGQMPEAERLGPANPGALSLATVMAQTWGASGSNVRLAGAGTWVAFVVALVAVSLPFLRAVARGRDARRMAMAALFLYLLIVPRPMAYGFVLLTPAVLYFAPRPFDGPRGRLALGFVLAAQGLTTALSHADDSVVFVYAPFLLALCLWLLVLSSPPARLRSDKLIGP